MIKNIHSLKLKCVSLTVALALLPFTVQANDISSNNPSEIKLTPEVTADNIDHIYRERPTNSVWEHLTPAENYYDSPFQVALFSPQSGEDGERLWSQTSSIFAYGFGVIGLIALLPEDISNWDKEEGIFNKWSDNVKDGPVWDRDTGMLNFVGHPYFGGVYYQVARKSGYRQWDAFVYSTLMSTFYWEYGIEAFAETPSIQDLVITPVLGWAYGEWAYNTEMDIREQGGSVWGSDFLGSTALFFLDPVDYMSAGINNIFGKEIIKAGTGYLSFNDVPLGDNGHSENQVKFNISLQLGDGGSYSGNKAKHVKRTKDPIHTGIIGITYGVGAVDFDEQWQADNDKTTEYSLGLYFTREFSSRVTYSKAKVDNLALNREINYENYSLDSQYYFNSEHDFRPYVTAGFGETMWQKEQESTVFQVNAGVGAHYKLNKNFALQLDYRYFHSTSAKTSDQNVSARIVYFLGQGER
ncbi:DUF3943 domain-containing protein [Colwellia sp. D2M02]|uniref:DUF3943 domain-containing protein n=1 Tax=Colwellia sp. D2M02 TaxID=2841562 RepID=UPI001C0A5DFC|nr:DUF3943 domain-containing protein [Colwellia sp. D2M02]MBU2894936.1 DUF3943 domain-containing protein [Colwellia sp. D2M02]